MIKKVPTTTAPRRGYDPYFLYRFLEEERHVSELYFSSHSFIKKRRGQEKDATKQNSLMRQIQIGLSQPAPIASTARFAYHAGVSLCFLLFYAIFLCYWEMTHQLCQSN